MLILGALLLVPSWLFVGCPRLGNSDICNWPLYLACAFLLSFGVSFIGGFTVYKHRPEFLASYLPFIP